MKNQPKTIGREKQERTYGRGIPGGALRPPIRSIVLLFSLITHSLFPFSGQCNDVTSVYAAHVEAIGGAAAIDAVQTIQRTGTVALFSAHHQESATWSDVSTRSELFYSRQVHGDDLRRSRGYAFGYNGTAFWLDGPIGLRQETRPFEFIMQDVFRRRYRPEFISPLIFMALRHELESFSLAGNETIDGKPQKVLTVEDGDFGTVTISIDAASYFVSHMAFNSLRLPDERIVFNYSGHQTFGDIVLPTSIDVRHLTPLSDPERPGTNAPLIAYTVEGISINGNVAPGLFSRNRTRWNEDFEHAIQQQSRRAETGQARVDDARTAFEDLGRTD